jgi:hypothetical protein
MQARDFCFWLQGYFELALPGTLGGLNADQLAQVRAHLALVFKHEIDPSVDGGDPLKAAEHQAIHDRPQIGGVGPGGQAYRC